MTTEPESTMQIRTDLRAADHVIVSVAGEVDLETAPELERRLVEVIERGTPVVVDLERCTYMDSSGFRVLHHAADLDRIVLVIPPGAFLARVVQLAGLAELMAVCDDIAAALQHLQTPPAG